MSHPASTVSLTARPATLAGRIFLPFPTICESPTDKPHAAHTWRWVGGWVNGGSSRESLKVGFASPYFLLLLRCISHAGDGRN